MSLGSGIRKKPIPDPGIKKAPDPGSRDQKGTGSRIRNFAVFVQRQKGCGGIRAGIPG